MRSITDIDYAGNGEPMNKMDIFLPDEDNFDMLIYFHGGGLERGSRKAGKRYFSLTESGIAVASAEYRMYPDASFPDFIEDAAKCVSFVLENLEKWGGNGRVFVTGSSAGAYITMMLCLDKSYLENVGVNEKDINGFISESAQQFAHFKILKYSGKDPRQEVVDETAPIFYVKDGLEIRPLLILYYSDDMACRPEENRLMFSSLKRFLPEDAELSVSEIKGKHCEPEDMNDLLSAITGFIKNTK